MNNFKRIHNLNLQFLENKEHVEPNLKQFIYKEESDDSGIDENIVKIQNNDSEDNETVETEQIYNQSLYSYFSPASIKKKEIYLETLEKDRGNSIKTNTITTVQKQQQQEKQIQLIEKIIKISNTVNKKFNKDELMQMKEIELYKYIDELENYLEKKKSTEVYKNYLLFSFIFIDFLCRKVGFNTNGYIKNQMSKIDSYDELLFELSAKRYVPCIPEDWPVEAKLISTILLNTGLFFVQGFLSDAVKKADDIDENKQFDIDKEVVNDILEETHSDGYINNGNKRRNKKKTRRENNESM